MTNNMLRVSKLAHSMALASKLTLNLNYKVLQIRSDFTIARGASIFVLFNRGVSSSVFDTLS